VIARPQHYARSSEYFGALDGFRGILALCVAIYHTIWLTNINGWDFFNNGAVIIDLFFVFSGFLMYCLYQDKLGTLKESKTFLKRRFARLYPIHLFMTLVFVAYAVLRIVMHKIGMSEYEVGEILPFHPGAQDEFYSLFTHLTLTHSMGLNDSLTFNPPSWTISVEFFAYFTFAALLMWLPPRKAWHFVGIAMLIGVIFIGLSRIKPNMDITYDLAFWRCLGGFYTGVIGAWVYSMSKARLSALSTGTWTVIEIFVLSLSLAFVIYCPGKLQFFVAPVAFLFVLAFAFDKGLLSKFMSQKIFRYLGKISYSVYMIHVIISIFFAIFAEHFLPLVLGESWNATGLGGDMYLVPYLGIVIICSHITYHLIEVPGRKWIQKTEFSRLFKRRSRAIDTET